MYVGAAIGLIATLLLPMGQKSYSHSKEVDQSLRHYAHDKELDAQRHKDKLLLSAAQYKAQHTSTLHCYAEGMAVALDLARRETVRDVWVQRSMLNQTIMLNGALMLSCAFENFSQSALPRTSVPMQIEMLYALNGMLGMAILLCVVCIVLCLKIQERLGWYALGDPSMVYHCGRTHATFNDYFDCHCEGVRNVADWLFYGGGACTIVSSILLQAIKYHSNHNSDAAALIAIHTISAGAGLVALPLLVRRFAVGKWLSSSGRGMDYGGLGAATEEEQQHQKAKLREQIPLRTVHSDASRGDAGVSGGGGGGGGGGSGGGDSGHASPNPQSPNRRAFDDADPSVAHAGRTVSLGRLRNYNTTSFASSSGSSSSALPQDEQAGGSRRSSAPQSPLSLHPISNVNSSSRVFGNRRQSAEYVATQGTQ